MSRANKFAFYKLKQILSHPYSWLLIVVCNIYIISSLLNFDRTLSFHNMQIPGSVYMTYLTGSWLIVTYGVFILFILFVVLYYRNPNLDKQMMIRLGGRNILFAGKILSFLYLSLTFFITIFFIPVMLGIALGNHQSGWGDDLYSASLGNETSDVHPIIDALTQNSSYLEQFSPITSGIIHLFFLWCCLFLLMILLDLLQHLLASVLWGTIATLGYAFSYILLAKVLGTNIFSRLTMQPHVLLLFKVKGSGEFIPYSTSILYFIVAGITLLGILYWKERYSHI